MPPVPAGLHTLTGLELCPTAAASRTGAGTIARGAARRRHDADEGAERSIAADTFGRVVACRIDDGCRQPEARHDAVIDAAVDLDRAGALTTKRSSS
jgi:hypothetical protein